MQFLNTIPWWTFALAGALFAGATNVLIKAGMKGVDSYYATGVRTAFSVPIVWLVALLISSARFSDIARWTPRNWVFLGLSATASGLSWVCAYKSIDLAGVARTLPIDKSSIAFGFILAVLLLGERPSWQSIIATLLVMAALAVTLIPENTAKAGPAPALIARPASGPSATRASATTASAPSQPAK